LLYEKINRLKDAQLNSDLAFIIEQLNEWQKARPDNQPLKEVIKAFVGVYDIVQSYQCDRQMYHKAISEYRSDKLRAIERARRNEIPDRLPSNKTLGDLTEKINPK